MSSTPLKRSIDQTVAEPIRPLRLVLVDDYPERAEVLERALTASGHQIIARFGSGADLRSEVMRIAPDVIIIDVDSADRD
ncbi:MAG: response regulator NasT, partial [Gammaproteobacteria bacterium]